MDPYRQGAPRLWQGFGCMSMLLLILLCLMPFFVFDTMRAALEKLYLSPTIALVTVLGIFIGGLINIAIYRIPKEEVQLVETAAVFGFWGWTPRVHRYRRDSIVAINVGGCVIPLAVTAWEVLLIVGVGGWPLRTLAIAAGVNVLVCYLVARPVRGVGIMMPGFISPVVAVGLTWLLLASPAYDPIRAPVAFVAGVLGPLIGADLFHLKDISRVSAGILSIGGAGTFDGIVLSGILAALLA
jgi:uncharacterized membrane protein